MKLIIAFLIVTVFQASAISKAQNVTIKATPGSLETVFNAIHQQTGYNFIYNSAMIKKSGPVNIDVNEKPLKETLDQVFADQPLGYVIEDQTIVVTKRAATAGPVTGTVTDADGATLPGVTVKIKGTSIVTSTDLNGKFHVNLPVGNEVLVFSFIGYKTQEIPASGQKSFSIKLEEGTSSLDEVVVIGYGVMKKRDLTGAVASVKGADIASNPVSNPLEALQGRVSGVDVQRPSGQAGQAPTLIVRGTRSINGGANPLYIVDGIQGASADNVNPNDIESIDVLKDASSTAIYGSQAANGVIIITTKKAKAGKAQIELNSYYGMNGFASYPKPLQGDQWLQYQKDRFFAANGRYPTDLVADLGLSAANLDAIQNNQTVDWVAATLKRGSQQNHHVAIRGGSDNVRGDFSLGLIDEKGIYQGDEVKTYNSRSGAEVKFSKIITGGIRNTVTWKDGSTTNSRVNKAYGLSPFGVPYKADGSVNLYPYNDGTVSPIANYAPGVYVDNTKNLNLSVNPYLIITPIKNLSIRSNLSLNYDWKRNGHFENENSYNVASLGPGGQKAASYTTNVGYNYLWENIVNYNFTINKDHAFGLTAVTSYGDTKTESEFLGGTGLDYDGFLYYNLGALSLINNKGTSYTQKNLASLAGRFNYNYKGKYLLQASWRIDGASQLVHKWSQFPSVSGGWTISDEKFMDRTKNWLSNLKLRAGWGIVGNSGGINPYSSVTQVTDNRTSTPLNLGGATAALPIYILTKAVTNPDLKWERSANTNIGFDASFFRDRIQFSAEVYYTNTTGLLYARNLPSTSGGFDAKNPYQITQNIGTSTNRGIELTASGLVMKKKGFTWNTSLTYTRADERLTSLDLGNSVTPAGYVALNLFVGSPIKSIYGYKKIGIWQTDEAAQAALYGAKPGDIKLKTVPIVNASGVSDNGVHPYNTNQDKQVVGHENPDWMGGWQNTFQYKNFDLTVYLTARFGQTVNAQILGYWNSTSQPSTYNYWTPSNPTNDFPQPISKASINDYSSFGSSLALVDGSFWKIKNLTLGYTLPNKLAQVVGISNLRIYGTAYNPFIFTRNKMLKGVDPENGGADSFPLYKQIVFGVNVTF